MRRTKPHHRCGGPPPLSGEALGFSIAHVFSSGTLGSPERGAVAAATEGFDIGEVAPQSRRGSKLESPTRNRERTGYVYPKQKSGLLDF